jgi:RNA polymerase sigma-70 factor (ECF subfamily)
MDSLLSDARILSDSVSEPAMFSSLYEGHLRAVASYVARRTGAELSEDLTAEVFVRAFRRRAGFVMIVGARCLGFWGSPTT